MRIGLQYPVAISHCRLAALLRGSYARKEATMKNEKVMTVVFVRTRS